MTDDGTPRRRAIVAAVLWFVLAFCIWNVRFDWGVRVAASQYLDARSAYLNGRGARVELADTMHRAIADSVRGATLLSAPVIGVAFGLMLYAARRRGSMRKKAGHGRTRTHTDEHG
jgi:hypothetical protein